MAVKQNIINIPSFSNEYCQKKYNHINIKRIIMTKYDTYCLGIFTAITIIIIFIGITQPVFPANNKTTESNNIVYKITIDSVATDSLFGKQWRYK